MQKFLQHSLVRYIVVGLGSLAVDYFLLLILFHGFGVQLAVASSISFLAGLTVNFLLNKYWSFQAGRGLKKSTKQAVLYALLVGFNLLFTNFFIVMLQERGIGPEISKPVTTAMITLWNFALYKTVIFKDKDEKSEPTV